MAKKKSVPVKRIEVNESQVSSYVFRYGGKLEDYRAALAELESFVPQGYHDSIYTDVEAYDDYGSPSVYCKIYYYRPMTPEEIADEKAEKKKHELEMQERRRKQFEALKAEFGES